MPDRLIAAYSLTAFLAVAAVILVLYLTRKRRSYNQALRRYKRARDKARRRQPG